MKTGSSFSYRTEAEMSELKRRFTEIRRDKTELQMKRLSAYVEGFFHQEKKENNLAGELIREVTTNPEYSQKYSLQMSEFTAEAFKNVNPQVKTLLFVKRMCGVAPHYIALACYEGKKIFLDEQAFLRLQSQGEDHSETYCLPEAAFFDPVSETFLSFQADGMSCAILSLKTGKTLFNETDSLWKYTVFDQKNRECHPHPFVFKYAQSESFLQNYIKLYKKAFERLKDTPENANLPREIHDPEGAALKQYRETHFGKHRLLYFCAKYYGDKLAAPILSDKLPD